jgi:hypothetical protein
MLLLAPWMQVYPAGRANAKSQKQIYRKRQPGGIVKAEGLGDGPAHGKVAIAKLRLTLPPTSWATLRLP